MASSAGSALTAFGTDALLNILFGVRRPVPAAYFLALLTTAPAVTVTGTALAAIEPTVGETGYVRAQVPNVDQWWAAGSAGATTTAQPVTFAPALMGWPEITHYALCDAVTGGNVYLYGRLSVPRQVKAGDAAAVPPGLLEITTISAV